MHARHTAMTVLSLSLVLAAALPCSSPAFTQSVAGPGLSTPVRGVWMHPGFFGPEKTAAVELNAPFLARLKSARLTWTS